MRTDLPNWTTTIDEISNGIFKVTLVDKFGRKVETIDNATDDTVKRTIADAFEMEKQTTKNWNRFLYELSLLLLRKFNVTFNEYNDLSFGSWFIEISNRKRIVYNGRDYWLIIQEKKDAEWAELESIENIGLTYYKLLTVIDNL
ncbi:MAG: hypothetical protein KBF82_14335 [Chitinophagaceae bacterium]|nr:hypothetical protein [Chitinophagaceae bacterium]MBP9105039.1 hypothetical protein [Chitinophagaceae bacterium]